MRPPEPWLCGHSGVGMYLVREKKCSSFLIWFYHPGKVKKIYNDLHLKLRKISLCTVFFSCLQRIYVETLPKNLDHDRRESKFSSFSWGFQILRMVRKGEQKSPWRSCCLMHRKNPVFRLEKKEEDTGTKILCLMMENVISIECWEACRLSRTISNSHIWQFVWFALKSMESHKVKEKIGPLLAVPFPFPFSISLHWLTIAHRRQKGHRKNEGLLLHLILV